MKPREIIFTTFILILLTIGIAGRCVEWVVDSVAEPWVDHPNPLPKR